MDYTADRILQDKLLEWVAFPSSRGSSQPRDRTQVSHIAGGFFTSWAAREAHSMSQGNFQMDGENVNNGKGTWVCKIWDESLDEVDSFKSSIRANHEEDDRVVHRNICPHFLAFMALWGP